MRFQRFRIVIALAGSAFAQSGAPVIGSSGYPAPVPLTLAPGQLVTLFMPGFGNVVGGPIKASAGPLPNTLAGVSVVFRLRIGTTLTDCRGSADQSLHHL